MFLGTHTPRLDDKGRLFLPAKFRADLAAGLVITRGHDRCLFVYPMVEFARLAEAASVAPSTDGKARAHVRMLSSAASDEIPDRQGRITIPAGLRSYAGLDRDCAVIGAINHVEIWDAASWATWVAANEQDYSDRNEEVIPGLL